MKVFFSTSLVLFIFSMQVVKAAEVIKFHVTTIDGEDLSNVNIRIVEAPNQDKYTADDGFCTIWSTTEKFQDIGILVFRKGWTVIKPKVGNYFRIDYREKTKVIEIQMQQNEEIYQKKIDYGISNSSQPEENINYYKSITFNNENKVLNFQIQIKASYEPIQNNLLENWENNLALRIQQLFTAEDSYPYKYRINLGSTDRVSAKKLLHIVQKSGFQDAFLISR